MKWGILGVFVLLVVVSYFTGVDESVQPVVVANESVVEELRVGTFNIQTLGQTKIKRDEVLNAIIDAVESHDILAVQELRDASTYTLDVLTVSLPPNYQFVVSDRLGRTQSKEQYIIFYNEEIVQMNGFFVQPDPQDIFEREPFQVQFSAQNFSFILSTNHFKPDDVDAEMAELERISDEFLARDLDVIILGDLNADCRYFDPESYEKWWHWIVTDDDDTTVAESSCAYDRVILSTAAYENYLSYSINNLINKSVSDHYLITTVFDMSVQ